METFNPSSIGIPIPYTFANPNASSSSSSVITSPWMDPRIWSRLPHRLVDRVIAFLPPPAFFRARSVCKRWNSLLFSNSFLELYLQVSPHRPHWFLFFNHKSLKNYVYKNDNNDGNVRPNCEGYLFNPYEVTWHRLSFASVPHGFSPASSSGGLMCFSSNEAGSKSLLLCNPLVGSLTPLPPTLRPRLFPSIGLTVTNASVDVVVAGDDLISPFAVKNLTAESFHIDGGGFYSMWGTTSLLPRLCSLESGRMVYVEARFYCMNYSPFSVLAYDVAANHWCKIQAPMRRFLRSPNLVESRGKTILVAAVEKSKLNVPKSLRMWGLQSCGTTWVEIDRMPQQLYVQFEEVEGGRGFSCVGHGEFIIIVVRGSQDKAILFDFYRKRWLWIPQCPFGELSGDNGSGNDNNGGGELHGFAYEPRLATPVTALLEELALSFQSFNG
ncbi:protein UNUSUAL FLORAL ORGANS-like [Actinidia eriantha]|uniref:protein UNUSUAL FLORAL ORGANS-like n=1 Tax=Actinidia eriantha TaxID=165200 RepID=UPI00258EE3CB|nr:protein UNUSUAL FLORAL ORGANS-like [Actinidia eriantha]